MVREERGGKGNGAHIFKATTVKFGVRLRTWDTLPALNFVKKIAQGACRYCIAFGR